MPIKNKNGDVIGHTMEEDISFIVDSGFTFNIGYDVSDRTFNVAVDSLIFPTAQYCEYHQWRGKNLKEVLDEATGYVDQQNQYAEAIVYDYAFYGRQEVKSLAEKIISFRATHV